MSYCKAKKDVTKLTPFCVDKSGWCIVILPSLSARIDAATRGSEVKHTSETVNIGRNPAGSVRIVSPAVIGVLFVAEQTTCTMPN